jgi:hypothetical protein
MNSSLDPFFGRRATAEQHMSQPRLRIQAAVNESKLANLGSREHIDRKESIIRVQLGNGPELEFSVP